MLHSSQVSKLSGCLRYVLSRVLGCSEVHSGHYSMGIPMGTLIFGQTFFDLGIALGHFSDVLDTASGKILLGVVLPSFRTISSERSITCGYASPLIRL